MRALRSLGSLLLFCLAVAPASAKQDDGFAKGLALFNKHLYTDALQQFSDTPGKGDKEAQRIYYCALCYLHIGQTKRGEELFRQVCRDFPRSEAAAMSRKYLQASSNSASTQEGITQAGIARAGTIQEGSLRASSIQANSSPANSSEPNEFSVPFHRTAKGQLTVSADLQGCSMNMIFDTGAEECLFGNNQMSAANLSSVERKKSTILNSVSGPIYVFQIAADINLGPLKKKLSVCVQDTDMESGILGQPFFKGYSCLVDNQAGLIRFRKNGSSSNAAPLDSFAIPFTEVGDKIIVEVQLNGRNTDMCFDTGAFGVCLSKAQCERLGIKLPEIPAKQTRGPNGQLATSWEISANVSLGPIKKIACPVRVIESDTSYPLLGQNFFGDRTFNIDRVKNEIRFAH